RHPRRVRRPGTDRAQSDGVQTAALPHAQPEPGAFEGADPRSCVGVRLQWRCRHRGKLHLLPAPQDRPAHRRVTHSDQAGLRVHAEGRQIASKGSHMGPEPDAITGWWRRISLRAKVTGVTVAVLALGLVVAGIGTVPLLRNSLISNIDAQLPSLATSDLAERWFDMDLVDGALSLTESEQPPRASEYFFAIYAADGTFLAQAGGSRGASVPNFPETMTIAQAHALEGRFLPLQSEAGGDFHGSVVVTDGPGGTLYVQYV